MRYKDFKDLPKIRPHKPGSATQTAASAPDAKNPETDGSEQEQTETDIFLQAMHDVVPLKGQGRKVPAGRPPAGTASSAPEENGSKYLEDLVQGKVEFDIEFTTEYLQGSIRGLNNRTLRQLKAGEFSPEAHLDLHGLNAYDAHYLLLRFVKENYLAGKRCLLVIPGRGKNSPSGRGVLRDQIQYWLIRDPLKRVLLAFTTAKPHHGGAGALYLLLRKFKKSRGKIFWERYDLNSDL